MENKEKLLKLKEMLEKQLKFADEINNLPMCIEIGNKLNKIDNKLRELQAKGGCDE